MRIDKFLKLARIIKRRTIANEACDAGRVSVNGKTVKASYDIKVGDVISISYSKDSSNYKVLLIKENVRKDEVESLYEVV